MTAKQQLQKDRAYFKFVLHGLPKPLQYRSLTLEEKDAWETILTVRKELISSFNSRSRVLGLKVPEYRCWCGKEGKYEPVGYPEYFFENHTKVCKKHINYK